MPTRQPKVRVIEKTRITTRHKADGSFVESCVCRDVQVAANSTKHKMLLTLGAIEDMVKNLRISPEFGNAAAKVVKNAKPRAKHGRERPKQYIEYGNAKTQFKDTARTMFAELYLLWYLFKHPEVFGVDAERVPDLKDMWERRRASYYHKWPREALRNKMLSNAIIKHERKEIIEQRLRYWYAAFMGVPEWSIKMTFEELSNVFDEEVAKAQLEYPNWCINELCEDLAFFVKKVDETKPEQANGSQP